MIKTHNAIRNTRDAFTLIEIMLVIIIIGVLAAMVMPRLVGRSEQARLAVAKADIESGIALSLDLYEMDNGEYPDKLADLRVKPGTEGNWKGPYLKKEPVDPWGRPYKYDKGSDGKSYKICSDGPDEGKAEDDICNDKV